MKRKEAEFWPADDRDLMINAGPGFLPADLVKQMTGCATALLFVVSWAAIGGAMLWMGWPFAVWPFLVIPVGLWVVLLGGPLFVKMRRAALTTLDTVTRTSEAWAARAGWVVDLNGDGAIGHVKTITPAIQDVRPIIYTGRALAETHTRGPFPELPAGASSMADEAPNVLGVELPAAVPEPVERVKMWHLPNRERVREDALTAFVDGVFEVGWDRSTWLNRGMTRPQYDGCMALLCQARIITDRTQGFVGRLAVPNARVARRILDLPAVG